MYFATKPPLLQELQDNVAASPQEAARLRLEFNKQVLLEALRTLGIQAVTVTYAGSGDSGQVEGVEVNPETRPFDVVQVELAQPDASRDPISGEWLTRLELRPVSLVSALGDFCEDAIELAGHGGWENGDGGEGTLTLTVDTGEVVLEHTEFFTDSTSMTHTL